MSTCEISRQDFPAIPENYFPKNDPALEPIVNWRSHGALLFNNWLNYYVYQLTPFDQKNIGEIRERSGLSANQ